MLHLNFRYFCNMGFEWWSTARPALNFYTLPKIDIDTLRTGRPIHCITMIAPTDFQRICSDNGSFLRFNHTAQSDLSPKPHIAKAQNWNRTPQAHLDPPERILGVLLLLLLNLTYSGALIFATPATRSQIYRFLINRIVSNPCSVKYYPRPGV